MALITFGFTIYKFFAFEAGRELPASGLQLSPRVFGMIMIGTGLVALGLSAIAHRTSMRHLQADYGVTPKYGAFIVATIVSILGLLAFAAALMKA